MDTSFRWVVICLVGLSLLSIEGCRKDKPEEIVCDGSTPTYTGQIRAIINSNCTSSACHPGFTTYSGLQSVVQNGMFAREVLERRSMPRNGKLSTQALVQIKCWVENGYPEN